VPVFRRNITVPMATAKCQPFQSYQTIKQERILGRGSGTTDAISAERSGSQRWVGVTALAPSWRAPVYKHRRVGVTAPSPERGQERGHRKEQEALANGITA